MTDLPEAPASVTYSITTAGGYPALFTIREMSGLVLIEKMGAIEKKFVELGYKPQVKQSFGKEPKHVEYATYQCPQCGSKVVKETTKSGKLVEKCETNKYDYLTKQSTGCSYTKWL